MAEDATHAAAISLPLTVREWHGFPRTDEPVTCGVPMQPGALRDLSRVAIRSPEGARVPAQFAALAHWPDGSVRWLLCDFQASVAAKEAAVYTLADSLEPAPATPLRLEESEEAYTVTTGPLKFFDTMNFIGGQIFPTLPAGTSLYHRRH